MTTSLNMPQMLNVTTEVRLSSANSDAVMQKAIVPGNRRRHIPKKVPFSLVRRCNPSPRGPNPSMGMARIARLKNIIGARKKILLKGLLVAALRRSRIWVKAQRKPEKKAEEMMRAKPRASKAVSPATIIITPAVMVRMIRTNFIEGVSRWKRKAKRRTNARAEDLHIAIGPGQTEGFRV